MSDTSKGTHAYADSLLPNCAHGGLPCSICEGYRRRITTVLNVFEAMHEAARVFVDHVRTDYLHDGPGCSGMCEKAGALYKALAAAEGNP